MCDETDISLNGQSIKHTDTFKYLGVVLDGTFSFNDHVDYVRIKVSKILGMFSRIMLTYIVFFPIYFFVLRARSIL